MGKVQSWEVSDKLWTSCRRLSYEPSLTVDEFWERVEPLIPKPKRIEGKEYKRKQGGGRTPKDSRLIFEGIVYVLRTGCQWKALSKERFGSASSIHQYFLNWQKDGFFVKLWQAGLAKFDEMEGIAWEWQSIDSSAVKAPLGQEAVGNNPTDRGKKREQTAYSGGRARRPVINRRNRSE